MFKYFCSLLVSLGISASVFSQEYPNAIAPQKAYDLLQQDRAVLIDIRERDEIADGMAAPALWYPKSLIDSDLNAFVAELNKHKGKEIILYCRSGRRVSVVVEILAKQNIFVWNMGSYQAWADAGYPTHKP